MSDSRVLNSADEYWIALVEANKELAEFSTIAVTVEVLRLHIVASFEYGRDLGRMQAMGELIREIDNAKKERRDGQRHNS